jgi:exo-beta-1,3-glucanase (GH17 family)
MSRRTDHLLSLLGIDFGNLSEEELSALFSKYLEAGMHGLCFSSYVEGQGPGTVIEVEQIRQRMEIIKPFTRWVRTFSCTEGNELIPSVAREMGLKTLVGAWLSDDTELNEKEIEGVIEVAGRGEADLIAVGNEVLYRKELSEADLIAYIERVKAAAPGIPVGYVDAYYEFCDHPTLTAACDVVFANCYPFWEGCPFEYSLLYMKDMYRRAVKAAGGKRVIISETGWPNLGTAFQGSKPSTENAIKYFINAQKWSHEEGIEIFYFSSFDESWKIGAEGDVGAYWGIWDKDGKLKF